MVAADLGPSCSYRVGAHSIAFFCLFPFFNFSSIITVNDFFDCMLSGQKCCASSLFFAFATATILLLVPKGKKIYALN